MIEDALTNPDSSIMDIHLRTGFAQSHVSASVARLRERGLVETASDPADGRRTRVRVAGEAIRAIIRRSGRGIDEAIAGATSSPEQARRATELLEELADLLL